MNGDAYDGHLVGMTQQEVAQAIEERTLLVYYPPPLPYSFHSSPMIVVGTGFSGVDPDYPLQEETIHAQDLDGDTHIRVPFRSLRPATPEEIVLNVIEL